jgi:hypothetical protein
MKEAVAMLKAIHAQKDRAAVTESGRGNGEAEKLKLAVSSVLVVAGTSKFRRLYRSNRQFICNRT